MQPAQKLIGIAVLSLWAGAAVLADSDTVGTVEQLPAVPGKHWLWVDDAVLNFMIAGRASLIDGDSGRFLGMVNTGYSFTQLTLPADHSWIYSAETYYSRYTPRQTNRRCHRLRSAQPEPGSRSRDPAETRRDDSDAPQCDTHRRRALHGGFQHHPRLLGDDSRRRTTSRRRRDRNARLQSALIRLVSGAFSCCAPMARR